MVHFSDVLDFLFFDFKLDFKLADRITIFGYNILVTLEITPLLFNT
jgi:hypothetical protein